MVQRVQFLFFVCVIGVPGHRVFTISAVKRSTKEPGVRETELAIIMAHFSITEMPADLKVTDTFPKSGRVTEGKLSLGQLEHLTLLFFVLPAVPRKGETEQGIHYSVPFCSWR